ncbi:RHOMBOID-like protein 8 isoform X2 [Telopea speciosissima]|uniref:RHOMBOID-like protein 8 isoform X2 n=1 Tax=Telopea speciosissima TaxID=54955 RepID=UPI001CC36487|nr:RHOMBOID-like protein 8 isoform X2 [Telopea speciosissima]
MAETINDRSQIEIKPQEPPPFISFDFSDEVLLEQRTLLLRSRSQRKKNTWVISLFVFLHIVAFAATMFVNNCWTNSNGDCLLKFLGRFSFQPLWENPALGPSSSTLTAMGAIRRALVIQQHQTWRLVTCLLLHAGAIHFIINLSCILLIGIRLEQEFGPLRTGIIYTFSAVLGGLTSALFVHNSPAVASSSALFGLIGSMLSGIIRNWEVYSDKVIALVSLFIITTGNLILGLLPHIDNFSNIGGLLSGFLLGFVLLFNPQLVEVAQTKEGLFEYKVKSSVKFRNKVDKPVQRTLSLVLFALLFTVSLLAVLHGVDANKYCSWCHYVDCVPSRRWSCNEKPSSCEVLVSPGRLTFTCKSNDHFRVYLFTNISRERMEDLCSLICA